MGDLENQIIDWATFGLSSLSNVLKRFSFSRENPEGIQHQQKMKFVGELWSFEKKITKLREGYAS